MTKQVNQTQRETVNVLLEEDRLFSPSDELKRKACIRDEAIYAEAAKNREAFWAQWASELDWFRKGDKVLDWQLPFAKWFVGGKLNASYNCLDRHIKKGLGNKTAILWEGEPGDARKLTYEDVYTSVNKLANVLKGLGVGKGDRVAIYLPMIPEAVFSMLACARIGAVHAVVFGGFSADSLKERIKDAQAKLIITADGGYRRGKVLPLKETADEAAAECPTIEHILVVRRTGQDVWMRKGRDLWYHEFVDKADDYCEPERMDAEDMLYILYTSG